MLQKYSLAIDAKEDISTNILDALHMLHSAWNLKSFKTIDNCFGHAEFSKVADSLAPKESADIETGPTFSEIFKKVSTLLACPTASLEEFVVDYDNLCTAPIMAGKDILEIVQSSKDAIDVDSDEEFDNEVNIAVPILSTLKMRNTQVAHKYCTISKSEYCTSSNDPFPQMTFLEYYFLTTGNIGQCL